MSTAPRRHRILIVDDEQLVLNALRRSLRNEPYELELHTDARAALDALKTFRPDLVLSDHLMPQMSGLEFLKVARERHPDSVRLMLTGHADMQTAIKALNHGEIYRFLTKPWDGVQLKTTLHLACEQLDLQREQREVAARVRCSTSLLEKLRRQFPNVSTVVRDASGAIVIDELAAEQVPS